MKKILCTTIIFSLVFYQFCICLAPLAAQERKKVAVFPFEDTNKEAKDVGYGSAVSKFGDLVEVDLRMVSP